jgi:Na+/H+-dicarboxylate symporter
MIHFIYLLLFALFVSIIFGVVSNGTLRQRVLYGLKTFAEFLVVSLVLAWIFYFLPW